MDSAEHERREMRMSVEATDGYRVRYRTWPAVADRAEATVVLLNGIMSNSAWFFPIVEHLPELHVVGADRRGSGPNTQGRGDAPSAGQLVDDVLRIVQVEHDPSHPLFLLGWCWGAALAVNVASKLGDALAGLVAVTPGLYPGPAVKQALAMQAYRFEGAAADALVLDSPISEDMFTSGPALEGFIRRDRDRVLVMTPRMLEVTNKLATVAVARLDRLRVPMLLVLAADDEATDNEATRAAFARIPTDQRTEVELPSRHGVQFDAPQLLSHHLRVFMNRARRARADP